MLTSREFLRAAEQRFTAAEYLLDQHPLDAFYLAGYSVECGLKALIMHLTAEADRPNTFTLLKSTARMHHAEHLKEILKAKGCPIPLDLVKGLRRFGWSTELRYEHGRRRPGEVRGYLKVAKRVLDWATGEMT